MTLRYSQSLTEALTEAELIEAVKSLQTDVRSIKELLEAQSIPRNIPISVYPSDGNTRALPAGPTRMNLVEGLVIRPDGLTERMSNSLKTLGVSEFRSGAFHADCFLDIEPKWHGQIMGKFRSHESTLLALRGVPMDEVIVTPGFPVEFHAIFSTSEQVAIQIELVTWPVERYGEITTTDIFENVRLGPEAGGALPSAFRAGVVHAQHSGVKVFFVHNTGSNDANVNLQLRHVVNRGWVNSAVTGASLNIPAGDNAIIEEGLFSSVFRFRARSNVAGSPTTVEVQYGQTSMTR
mgnify:CR=1 FL=1